MSQDNYIATKLKSDSVWVACGFAINALSSLVISMLLTRILDTNSVGVYFLAFSISIMLSSIIQFGFNITVVKLISSAEASGGAQNLRLLLLKILFFIVTFLLVFGAKGIFLFRPVIKIIRFRLCGTPYSDIS